MDPIFIIVPIVITLVIIGIVVFLSTKQSKDELIDEIMKEGMKKGEKRLSDHNLSPSSLIKILLLSMILSPLQSIHCLQ